MLSTNTTPSQSPPAPPHKHDVVFRSPSELQTDVRAARRRRQVWRVESFGARFISVPAGLVAPRLCLIYIIHILFAERRRCRRRKCRATMFVDMAISCGAYAHSVLTIMPWKLSLNLAAQSASINRAIC